MSFIIEDASSIFYDFGAFGTILKDDYDSKALLEQISEKRERPFQVGEYPEVFYYTGKNRAKLITESIDKFPEFELVIDQTINCRNFYVHGSSKKEKLTAEDRSHFSIFFTDTLEFVFAASELIEAGWDIKEWVSKGSCLSHPFARYIHSYPSYSKDLLEKIQGKAK